MIFPNFLWDFQRFPSGFPGLPPLNSVFQLVSTVVTAGCFVEQVLGHETLRSNSFGGFCRVEFLLKASTYSKNSYDFGVNNFFSAKKHLGWDFLAYWKIFEPKVNTVPNTGHSRFQVIKRNILGVNKRESVAWDLSSNFYLIGDMFPFLTSRVIKVL